MKRQEEELSDSDLSSQESNHEFLDSFFEKVKLVDTPPSRVKFGLHSDTLHAVNRKKLRMV